MLVDGGPSSFHCRVVLIGDPSVGKTSILSQLVDRKFDPCEESTIGANYQIYIEEVDGVKVEIQIWDTAGQEKFKSLGPIYFRNALGAIAVYDVTMPNSFDHVEEWLDSFCSVVGTNAVMFVVGNKIDKEEDRKISFEDAKTWAEKRGCIACETSAKTGEGVEPLFTMLAKELLKGRQTTSVKQPALEIVEKKSCC